MKGDACLVPGPAAVAIAGGVGTRALSAARPAICALAVMLCGAAAHAQSTYVAGSLGADAVRTGSIDGTAEPGSGEALSFSLRAGGAVTPHFGVELDFTRPAEIENDATPDVRILAASLGFGDVVVPPSSSVVGYRLHTIQRTTTITASAWARQEIGSRLSLVYLGGVAFAKVDRSVAASFDFLPAFASVYRPVYETRTVNYDQGPMAGLEARIALTEHAWLVPGMRLLSVGGGWIMRPAIAVAWAF